MKPVRSDIDPAGEYAGSQFREFVGRHLEHRSEILGAGSVGGIGPTEGAILFDEGLDDL